MNTRVVVIVSVMVALTVVNLLWPRAESPISVSSFGRAGSGHGALYDLLTELEANRGRSLQATSRLEGSGTLWWIDPLGVCDGRIAMGGEVDVLDEEDVAWRGRDWLAAGGTGVVFLQSADPGGPLPEQQELLVACDAIAGFVLPPRRRLGERRVGEEQELRDAALLDWDDTLGASVTVSFGSADPAETRELPVQSLFAFEESLDWTVVAEVRTPDDGGLPFALRREVGDGALVVVADSAFTHNRWLDADDSAALALDFTRAYGAPRFDEREHGILPETGIFRFIASSPALPVFLGLTLLGGLYAWRGSAVPARSVEEFDPAAPTLDTYVSSMATLYAGTHDYTRVLERYRELTAAGLRRHFGLSAAISRRALAERIAHDRPVRSSLLSRLTDPQPATNAAELAAAASELEELSREVMR